MQHGSTFVEQEMLHPECWTVCHRLYEARFIPTKGLFRDLSAWQTRWASRPMSRLLTKWWHKSRLISHKDSRPHKFTSENWQQSWHETSFVRLTTKNVFSQVTVNFIVDDKASKRILVTRWTCPLKILWRQTVVPFVVKEAYLRAKMCCAHRPKRWQ